MFTYFLSYFTSVPPPPFSPSLMSLTVSVDVKHMFTYLFSRQRQRLCSCNACVYIALRSLANCKHWFTTSFLESSQNSLSVVFFNLGWTHLMISCILWRCVASTVLIPKPFWGHGHVYRGKKCPFSGVLIPKPFGGHGQVYRGKKCPFSGVLIPKPFGGHGQVPIQR